MSFKDLFTSYSVLEPPKRLNHNVDNKQFNFNHQPMGIITDVQNSDFGFNNFLQLSNPFDREQAPVFMDSPFDTPFDTYIPKSFKQQEPDLKTNVVNNARKFLGKPYIYGSSNPDKGFDCSGLIQYAYKQVGIQLPRTSHEIAKAGKEVSLSEIQPGDIIYTTSSGPSGGHVKMVSDVANGQITVIEAKGKKWGIVESVLTNTSNIKSIRRIINNYTKAPTTTQNSGTFRNKTDFIRTLTSTFKEVLEEHNLDPKYAYILTSSAALESGWGKKVSGAFNYGGVKAKTGTIKSTIDYIPGKGNIRHLQTFRDFNSVKDYCNYIVDLLQKDRYKSFSKYSATEPMQFWKYTLEAGYGGGSAENIHNYMKSFSKIYDTVRNT